MSGNGLESIRNRGRAITEQPFRHIILDDFFTDDYYQALCAAFNQTLNNGLSETHDLRCFSRFQRYDAYYWPFPPASVWPLAFFYSTAWRDYLCDLFAVTLVDDVSADFHHHPPHSQSGSVHNDYNPAFFPDNPPNGHMNPFYYQCSYHGKTPQSNTRERARALSVLYYLNNPEWTPSGGGETALYAWHTDPEPFRSVAPINNRLLVFECGPGSFHRFLGNRDGVRNSMMQWFHGEKESVVARFNGVPLVPW